MKVRPSRRAGSETGGSCRPRPARYHAPWLVAQVHLGVTYRGGWRGPALTAALVGAAAGAAVLTGHVLPAAVSAALVVLLWLGWAVRLMRVTPLGPGPGGGAAGVREPRRPKPGPPSGAVALAVPGDPRDDLAGLA